MRTTIVLLLVPALIALGGCSRASWTRADLFSTKEAPRSHQVVAATIESLTFPGGDPHGMNIRLDEPVATDQGTTRQIYLEQPVRLPTGITLMKRVRVHFDFSGSPLYLEEIKPAKP